MLLRGWGSFWNFFEQGNCHNEGEIWDCLFQTQDKSWDVNYESIVLYVYVCEDEGFIESWQGADRKSIKERACKYDKSLISFRILKSINFKFIKINFKLTKTSNLFYNY